MPIPKTKFIKSYRAIKTSPIRLNLLEDKKTSPKIANYASLILKIKAAKIKKSIAASVLSQADLSTPKYTSIKLASSAGKKLSKPKTPFKYKQIAGSALSQAKLK